MPSAGLETENEVWNSKGPNGGRMPVAKILCVETGKCSQRLEDGKVAISFGNRGEVFNSRDKTCACPGGQEWNGHECRWKADCGKDAYFNKWEKKCVCRNHDQSFNSRDKKCYCPDGEVLQYGRCTKQQHQVDCGRDAYYSKHDRKCVCKVDDQVFNRHDKKCYCLEGEILKHGRCVKKPSECDHES